ncbi:MAG TPA: hopanoid biosynthesis-associated protein HpnK [Thermoanaerobaculia bacterium]|jgi:hopanoid biosynthesis associated protein HpnK
MEAGGPRLRKLIVTGDDFGFSRGVNRAIVQAHERGILTSASLMITGEASEEAISLAKAHPRLAVGLHLVVVAGKAALTHSEIPRLTDAAGRFPSGPVRTGLRYQFQPAARRELRKEIRAQLERFRQTGLTLSHVDGHLHMHLHPVVLGTLVELADEFAIPAIRLPSEELGLALALDPTHRANKLLFSWIFRWLRRYGERRISGTGVRVVDRVYGLLATGRVSEGYLLRLLPRISAAVVEIYCHPDYGAPGEPSNGPPGAGLTELAALLSSRVRQVAAERFALSNPLEALPSRRQNRPGIVPHETVRSAP